MAIKKAQSPNPAAAKKTLMSNQDHLKGDKGDKVAMCIRIPRAKKMLLEQYAAERGMTVTAVVLDAIYSKIDA